MPATQGRRELFTGAVRGWKVGTGGNYCGGGTPAAAPGCMIQVGRWYRMVRILNLGTPDVADGSYDVWIYDDSMALVAHMFVHNVKMLSSIYDGESGHPKPDQGYIRKTIWSHYHPGGNSVNPRKKPFTDFVCYANLYISAVPFE